MSNGQFLKFSDFSDFIRARLISKNDETVGYQQPSKCFYGFRVPGNPLRQLLEVLESKKLGFTGSFWLPDAACAEAYFDEI